MTQDIDEDSKSEERDKSLAGSSGNSKSSNWVNDSREFVPNPNAPEFVPRSFGNFLPRLELYYLSNHCANELVFFYSSFV